MLDFMGLAAAFITPNYKRDIVVIGMTLMNGSHNAENIKLAIEKIVNEYSFDKKLIHGCSSDEGSAYVRLMKQIEISDDEDDDSGDILSSFYNYDQDREDFEADEVRDEIIDTQNHSIQFDAQMKSVYTYSHGLKFDKTITAETSNPIELETNNFNFEQQELDMYEFSRPFILNEK